MDIFHNRIKKVYSYFSNFSDYHTYIAHGSSKVKSTKNAKRQPKFLLRMLALAFVLLISLQFSSAAILSGSTYDMSLNKESDVVIEINTVPKQLMISKDGDYAFNVKPGTYVLRAYTSTSSAYENVTITDDGEYILDLVLEDTIIDPSADIYFPDSNLPVSASLPKNGISFVNIVLYLFGGIIMLSLVFLLFKAIKEKRFIFKSKHNTVIAANNPNDSDPYETRILNMISKEKRTTQKDIRKEIPLSEAKISLILTDLEDKGKIRKIKKGRGNVLIFVKY